MYDVNEPWKGASQILISLDIGIKNSQVAFTFQQPGFPTMIHRVTRWPGQESQASAGLVPTALMYLDGQVKAVGYEALTPEAQEMAEDEGWSLTKGFPMHLFLSASGRQSIALDPLPAAVSLSTVYSDYMKYLLDRTRSYFWDHIIDGEAIWIKQWQLNNVTIVFKLPNSCSTREQEFVRRAFLGVSPSVTQEGSRLRLKTLTEGEAIIYEAMLSTLNQSPKLTHGANMIVCHTEESWTNVSTYRLIQQSSDLPYFSLIDDTRLAAGYLFVKQGLEAYLSQLLSGSNISPNDREEYIQSGLKDFGEQAMLAFSSPENDHSVCIAGSRFNNSELRARRGRMSISGHTLKSFFDPSVLEIIREIEHQVSKANSDTKMLILVGDLGENPYFRESIGQKLGRSECHIVDNTRRLRLGVEGALYWAAFGEDTHLKPLDITARIGTLVGERYDESDPDHQGRKVHQGHGGFNIIGNRWSEIAKLSDLTQECPSIRRRIVRSLNPSRKTTLGLDKMRFNLWVFENGLEDETVRPVWVKDTAGQTNPGFRMLCQVEADLKDWKGTLVHKYAKTKPKDALEMFLVVRLDGTKFYANLEWVEGEQTRGGPSFLLG